VTIVMIPQASHAAIAEQPAFISDALIAFARGLGEPFAARIGGRTAHAASR
jgi:hypothetical protein